MGRRLPSSRYAVAALLCVIPSFHAHADVYSDTGVTALWSVHSELNGSGVIVSTAEADEYAITDRFEFNPQSLGSSATVTYVNSTGATAVGFPNAVGTESGHADTVAGNFFGTGGFAPGVSNVWNFETLRFFNYYIYNGFAIAPKIVNQSFVYNDLSVADEQLVQTRYDTYVAQKGTIFINPGNTNATITAPGTMYNGITVVPYSNPNTLGTGDGRSKPDLMSEAPGTQQEVSYVLPAVSGIAAQLVQAGTANTGGAGTSAASTDPRTIKAFLLNGAAKPTGWTHTDTTPLDTRYGAGMVNAYLSYKNLAAGKKNVTQTTAIATGDLHPAINTGTALSSTGWNYQSITSNTLNLQNGSDTVHHYLLNLTGTGTYQWTSTLVWNRQANQTGINNLDLFLYNAATGSLVAQSVSSVDNVEQLYALALPAGQYDLQVLKRGGTVVSASETYALAWSSYLMGDANYDGQVDLADYDVWFTHVGSTPGVFMTGDLNRDGAVDLADYDLWFHQVGGNTSALAATSASSLTVTAVPEPASLATMLLGGILLLRRRRN